MDWFIDYDDVEISTSPSGVDAAGNPYIGLLCSGAGCSPADDAGVAADGGSGGVAVDAGPDAAAPDGSVPDAAAPDGGGFPTDDASTPPLADAAGAGGDAPAVDEGGGDSAGGCRVAPAHSGGSGALWWVLVGLAWLRVRNGERS